MRRKKILITYEYFLPAYKAGGPIQSIANLCRQLKQEYEFYILCSNTDHKQNTNLSGIESNSWNDFENGTAHVYYLSKDHQKIQNLRSLVKEIKPDFTFVNGIFSPLFSIAPLLFSDHKIISARGMVHPGALSQKSFKKKLFISLLKLMQVHKKTIFHATDEKEKEYITAIFGKKINVLIAQNFPNAIQPVYSHKKCSRQLKLVSVALIGPMKNHLLVLQALNQVTSKIVYDIYGPVKDEAYWNKCLQIIPSLPPNIVVNYKGSIEPQKLMEVLCGYDCFILPSKSENFGHAIYEALSFGIPVITSYFTPWNQLNENNAGWNVDVSDISSVVWAIETAANLDDTSFQQMKKCANEFAAKKLDVDKIKEQYRSLFR